MSNSVVFLYNSEAGRARTSAPAPLSLSSMLTGGWRPGGAVSGTGDPRWLEAALSHLRVKLGSRFEAIPCTSAEMTRRAAAEAAASGVETVIAAGGDGTLRAAAEGLAGTNTALGILPRGTVNVLAREMSIPLDRIDAALDICLGNKTHCIDLGKVGESYFLLMCSVGFDATAVQSVRSGLKDMVGASAYVLSGVTTLSTFMPPDMTLVLDGKEWFPGPAFTVIVSNSPIYGGDFRVSPDAEMDDGLLDICLFAAPPSLPPAAQRAAFVRQVSAVTLGLAASDPDIHLIRAQRIEMRSVPESAAQIDGDAFGTTPLIVEVAPKALAVRVAA